MVKTIMGAAVLAGAWTLVSVPTAGANPQCTDVGGATRCSNPGNVQIDATPRQSGPYLPYGCDPAYASLCYDGIPGIHIDTSDHDHHGGGGRHPRPHPHR